MGSQEVLIECGGFREGDGIGVEQQNSGYVEKGEDGDLEKEKGNIAEEVLVNLEEYWEDISDRLLISRMVSDSVIRGIVGAIEQEAAESIANKELEVANLKKFRSPHEVASDKYLDAALVDMQKGCKVGKETLRYLDHIVKEQFDEVEREIAFYRKSDAGRNSRFRSKLVECESWGHVDEKLERLKMTMDFVYRNYDEWQNDRSSMTNVEDVVIQTVLRGQQEELEEQLLEYNSLFSGVHYVDWIEKFKGVSHVGAQLDAILKTLVIPETGLVSHGSHDLDQSNGKLDATHIHVAETYDHHTLNHFTREELVKFFNDAITSIRRDHEKALEQKTDQYYRLRREYLKMASLLAQKDETNDLIRKKINDVILKVDEFLLENERFPALKINLESIGELKQKLDSLLSENHYLKGCLTERENDIRCLEREVSDLREQIVNSDIFEKVVCVSGEKDMLEDIEASNFVSSMMQELSGLVFTEAMKDAQIQFNGLRKEILLDGEVILHLEAKVNEKEDELQLRNEEIEKLRQEILDLEKTWEINEMRMEDLLILLEQDWTQFELASHELCNIREDANSLHRVVSETDMVLGILKAKHSEEMKQIEAGKTEINILTSELAQAKMLIEAGKTEISSLSSELAQAKMLTEAGKTEISSLSSELTQAKMLTEAGKMEISSLTSELAQATVLIEAGKMEISSLDSELAQAKMLIEAGKMEISRLNSELALAKMLMSRTIDKRNNMEETLKKVLQTGANRFIAMLDDFQSRGSTKIERSMHRLDNASLHLKTLSNTSNELKKTHIMCKKILERRCADLQLAETEVDLLGDQVDTLLQLLEKVYIALKHYSPVLKHYAGIMDILELVRRELSGESTKLHSSSHCTSNCRDHPPRQDVLEQKGNLREY